MNPLWHRTREALARVAAERFAEEGAPFDPAWLSPDRILGIVQALEAAR